MTSKRRKIKYLTAASVEKSLSPSSGSSITTDDSLDEIRILCSPSRNSDMSTLDNNTAHHHAIHLLKLLNSQRNDPSLCDYEIGVDGEIFTCHKCVLIGLSEFFKIMLTGTMKESRENYVELKGFKKSDGMQQILDFLYTGTIHLSFDNILSTLAFASHLQIELLLSVCAEFLIQSLNYSNCVQILQISDYYMLKTVYSLTQLFLFDNILEVYEQAPNQFVQLNYENLQSLLVHSQSLKTLPELDLFLMLAKWIQTPAASHVRFLDTDSACPDRLDYAGELMKSVRFMCISADELCDTVEKVGFMLTSPECKEFLTEAYRWHALPRRQPLINSEQTKLRGQEVLVAVGETSIFVLNEQKAQWDIVSSAPLDENYPYPFSVITVNNYLYVMGTRRSQSEEYRACYRFSPRTLEWTQLAPFLRDRSRFGMAYNENYIYVFGGFEGFKRSNRIYLNTIDRYSLAQDRWEEFSNEGPIMSCMAACSHDQTIYFGGGKNMNWSKVADFFSINAKQKRIEKKAQMLSARTTHQITVINDLIYALGGFDDAGNGILNIEAYDIKQDQWSIVTSIPGKISKTWPQSIGVISTSRFYISVFTTPNTFKIMQKGYYYDIKSRVWSEAPVIAERARYCPTTCVIFPPSLYNFDNCSIVRRLKHNESEYLEKKKTIPSDGLLDQGMLFEHMKHRLLVFQGLETEELELNTLFDS